MTLHEFSRYFDHTYLKNDMNIDELQQIILEANQYDFYSICIPPIYVKKPKNLTQESKLPQ